MKSQNSKLKLNSIGLNQNLQVPDDISLLDREIIEFPEVCTECGANGSYSWKDHRMRTIRCKINRCRKQFSIYNDTFLAKSG